jgi:hypothetical protein
LIRELDPRFAELSLRPAGSGVDNDPENGSSVAGYLFRRAGHQGDFLLWSRDKDSAVHKRVQALGRLRKVHKHDIENRAGSQQELSAGRGPRLRLSAEAGGRNGENGVVTATFGRSHRVSMGRQDCP